MAAGVGGGSDRRMMSEINVTPFVDVMLVLLVIFMVTAPMLQTGVDVQLPRAGSSPLGSSERAVTVTVDKDGFVHVERHRFTLEDFRRKAPALFAELKGRPVYIRGDGRISYGTVMAAMGVLKSAGVDRVGLVTEAEPGREVKAR